MDGKGCFSLVSNNGTRKKTSPSLSREKQTKNTYCFLLAVMPKGTRLFQVLDIGIDQRLQGNLLLWA